METVVEKIRYEKNNPVIAPKDIKPINNEFEIIGAFNPGVTKYKDKIVLLVRIAQRIKSTTNNKVIVPVVEDKGLNYINFDKSNTEYNFSDVRIVASNQGRWLTSLSSLVLACSDDGINFTIDYENGIFPQGEYEKFGIEDARITKIDDIYYITYSAISEKGICTTLQSTKDFINYNRHGNILCPDNKDSAIFPSKINGKYYMIHRPSSSEFSRPEIWIAESSDLISWGNHRHVMGVRLNEWDSARIGSSSVPIELEDSWLMLYHGADKNNTYCLGAVLLDKNDPQKVLKRSKKPFMIPTNPYEKNGFFSDVVFSCGCILENETITLYYGAADEFVCKAEVSLLDVLKTLD